MSPSAAIVLAPPLDDYPTVVTLPEPLILPVWRAEPCACGTSLVQHVGEPVAAVVARHNETVAHRAWRCEL